MKDQAIINRLQIEEIKKKLIIGEITYDEAREQATPIIAQINEAIIKQTKRLNAKYQADRRPALLTFPSAMR